MTKTTQSKLLMLTFVLTLATSGCTAKPVKWEYKVVVLKPTGATDEKSPINITPSEVDLNQLGSDGWEMVGCYPETETTFPNFGNGDYHTGIKSNTRSCRAVLTFKRPLKQ